MRRKLAPRIPCAICGTDFPKRGGKRTCSELCSKAYAAQRKAARPETPPKKARPAPPTSMQFITDRVRVTDSGCWEWQQSLNPRTGYGQLGYWPYTAHRLAFFFAHGRYPDGYTRHMCHNRACCNPDHLREGSARDNWWDSEQAHREASRAQRGRSAHNAKPVTVDGTTYPTKVAAMKSLRCTWKTLHKLAEEAA